MDSPSGSYSEIPPVTKSEELGDGTGKSGNRVTIRGVLDLLDSETAEAGCIGQGGYFDIRPGTVVRLLDLSGDSLGSTTLGPGKVELDVSCLYSFVIADVPDDKPQYILEVGRRGQVSYSRAEMRSRKWTLYVGLGY
jgi:hypothetical protein